MKQFIGKIFHIIYILFLNLIIKFEKFKWFENPAPESHFLSHAWHTVLVILNTCAHVDAMPTSLAQISIDWLID